MRGGSLLIEVHGWRGFGLVGGPLGYVLVIGLLSIQVVPFLITQWIKDAFEKLKRAHPTANVENSTAESKKFVPPKHRSKLSQP